MDKTDEVIAKTLEAALNAAQKTGDFIVEQAPGMIEEFLRWKLVENIFAAALSVCIVVFVFIVRNRISRKIDYDDEATTVSWLISILLSALPVIIFFRSCFNAMQIWVAPKVYLFEWITERLSGN